MLQILTDILTAIFPCKLSMKLQFTRLCLWSNVFLTRHSVVWRS